ncbi:hypothetical protein ACLKA7_017678 [Drosophila subpalustris]
MVVAPPDWKVLIPNRRVPPDLVAYLKWRVSLGRGKNVKSLHAAGSVHRCLLSAISVTICIVTSDRRVGERNHGVQQRYHFGSTVRTVTIVRSWSVPVYPWRASLPSPATAVTVCTVVVTRAHEDS